MTDSRRPPFEVIEDFAQFPRHSRLELELSIRGIPRETMRRLRGELLPSVASASLQLTVGDADLIASAAVIDRKTRMKRYAAFQRLLECISRQAHLVSEASHEIRIIHYRTDRMFESWVPSFIIDYAAATNATLVIGYRHELPRP